MSDYHTIKHCYGKKCDRLDRCSSCQWHSYCAEAGDPGSVPNRIEMDIEEIPTPPEQVQPSERAQIIARVFGAIKEPKTAVKVFPAFAQLAELSIRHPDSMAICMEYFSNPRSTKRSIAKKMGVSHTTINYHLQQVYESCPWLQQVRRWVKKAAA